MNYLFSEYPGINRPTQTMICHSIKSKELPENIVNCVTNKKIANVLGIKCNSNKNNWPKEFTSNDTWIIAYLISPEEEARIKECLPIKDPFPDAEKLPNGGYLSISIYEPYIKTFDPLERPYRIDN